MNEPVDTEALAKALAVEIGPAIAANFAQVAELEALRRKTLLTSEEVEKLYGLKTTTLKTWRHFKRGPAFIKDGGVILYSQKDLEAYTSSRRVRTGDQRV